MTPFTEHVFAVFVPQLLTAMTVNFKIAAIAQTLGLALGVALAMAHLGGRAMGAISSTLVGLMRSAPTFVVMFFLFNTIARDATLFGNGIVLSGVMIVALSLVPYATAYVADNGAEALRQLRRGAPLAALLFLPNVMRSFFVLVMSSSAGAAIGVSEGIAVILRETERLPSIGDKFILFAIGIACFGIALQSGFSLINWVARRLGNLMTRSREDVA